MADNGNDNEDTRREIRDEDRDLQQRAESRGDTSQQDRDKFQKGSAGDPGGHPEGEFAQQGEAAMGRAMGGGPDGTGNTGAELPGGAQSEFARTTGGQTGGLNQSADSPADVSAQGAGSVGTVGTVGAAGNANEYGAQGGTGVADRTGGQSTGQGFVGSRSGEQDFVEEDRDTSDDADEVNDDADTDSF
jgi:hypothetical protein